MKIHWVNRHLFPEESHSEFLKRRVWWTKMWHAENCWPLSVTGIDKNTTQWNHLKLNVEQLGVLIPTYSETLQALMSPMVTWTLSSSESSSSSFSWDSPSSPLCNSFIFFWDSHISNKLLQRKKSKHIISNNVHNTQAFKAAVDIVYKLCSWRRYCCRVAPSWFKLSSKQQSISKLDEQNVQRCTCS